MMPKLCTRVVGTQVVRSMAAVYAVKLGMTTQELADTWAPYLTMGEGLRLAAQAFTRDVGMLSCCAA
jgi:mercuric reductase